MTPDEMAEAVCILIKNPSLPYAEQIKVVREAFDEHVRALLVDSEEMVEAIRDAWEYEPGLWSTTHAAKVAIAALRRKALGE